jgi:hypothetical protein
MYVCLFVCTHTDGGDKHPEAKFEHSAQSSRREITVRISVITGGVVETTLESKTEDGGKALLKAIREGGWRPKNSKSRSRRKKMTKKYTREQL